jgi:hypothetical protein
MREIRTSGSEGGAGRKPRSYLYRRQPLDSSTPAYASAKWQEELAKPVRNVYENETHIRGKIPYMDNPQEIHRHKLHTSPSSSS